MKLKIFVLLTALTFLFGCATVRTVDPQQEKHYDVNYDYTDLHSFTNELVESMLSKQPLVERRDSPVAVIYGIDNRTDEHIDTQAITDAIRTRLIHKNAVRFVNITRREDVAREYEYTYSDAVDPSTRMALGKQLGAEYMITGSLYSIKKHEMKQIRLTKKELKWFKLTLELTDLETNIIVWTDEVEIAREASRPIIGW